MRQVPGLTVIFCLDIQRPYGDTSPEAKILERFVQNFRTRNWPWPETPELYCDPRSVGTDSQERSCLHAKCVIVDRSAALVTSANFTEAAQERYIKVGVLLHHKPTVDRLARYFEGLRAGGILKAVPN